jgi:hypothetical protein
MHDHDEELGMYWFGDPAANSDAGAVSIDSLSDSTPQRLRSTAYWIETGRLLMEYLVLQAGSRDREMLRRGFIRWLRNSPVERRRYECGDDMTRAALVDWFLRVVR